MEVYEESNRETGAQRWPRLSENEQILGAEEDFRYFLKDYFFKIEGAYYALWEESGRYCSALRLEPYEDGFLLAGLETKKDCRGKGFAAKLMQAVLQLETKPVYSHVSRKNIASLRTHEKCGFRKISDCARYIDGSVSSNAVTLYKEP